MDPKDILERVEILRHDLAKYLVLPVGMLPVGADRAALVAALGQALHRTRQAGANVQSARALWADFEADAGPALSGRAAYVRVEQAVQRALDWERALLDPGAELDRARILRELRAVGEALDALADELRAADDDSSDGGPEHG